MDTHISVLTTLYTAHRHELLAYLTTLLRNQDDAEDICHEAFLKAIRHGTPRNALTNPLAWLYQIARNTALDELRRRRRVYIDQLPDADLLVDQSTNVDMRLSTRDQVRKALAGVPSLYREALLLYVWYGYNVKDIAALCGCSTTAVKARLFRARAYFRTAYDAEMC
ncbi:MAG: hypothetical protein GFH27_549361n27 [Chloroflexi bacterium AL-W]|nr:hypothetical protein [Chloroflexi bacterium AL-N1]NOK70739.1 hypothetical protein [Chloroflexi bacterium AL-N10]NOK78299.1 hypothetical protein [Chloroflexi bacterium AL-N5]NOK85642.1 hypothetical protein [Chloroflexi bacterium AL-W]NOK92556.1 hypothetical protein [Chloroflexi bacterium AL-N15]